MPTLTLLQGGRSTRPPSDFSLDDTGDLPVVDPDAEPPQEPPASDDEGDQELPDATEHLI